MAALTPHLQPPTVAAIFAHYEARQSAPHRPHLGGSQIGHHCDAYLWHVFHWCDHERFDGRMLRLFDHGWVEETRLVKDLRAVGVTVLEVDPDTGKQWLFTAHGGHFGLSLDAVAHGFKESSQWHAVEFKTHSDKSFRELQQKGVEDSKPQHVAQMQIGMHLAELPRAYYLAVNKNTDAIHGERIRHDRKQGEQLLKRAERVIFSDDPLERISDRPDWYQCKFCPMHSVCHGERAAEVNCRTCLHSTAKPDGTWHCAKHDNTLSLSDQRAGCGHHLFRPSLVPAEQIDAGEDWVSYRTERGEYRNGAGGYTSHEIRANPALPLDEMGEKLRERFDGRVVG